MMSKNCNKFKDASAQNQPFTLGQCHTIKFASREEGIDAITARDDYILGMNPIDYEIRLQRQDNVTEGALLELYKDSVTEFPLEAAQWISKYLKKFADYTKDLHLPFPPTINFVATTGREESNAAYTRGNTIFFPESMLTPSSVRWIEDTLYHELFHVLSRYNPELRNSLYEIIGFQKCDPIELADDLKKLNISSPDSPLYDYVIEVQQDGNNCYVVPVVYVDTEKYNPDQPQHFSRCMREGLMHVQKADGNGNKFVPVLKNGMTKISDVDDVTGYFEQIGKNTNYITHPEEIMADNFVFAVIGRAGLQPNPEIPREMRMVMKEYAAHNTATPTAPSASPSLSI
jgi:hypothetical protein